MGSLELQIPGPKPLSESLAKQTIVKRKKNNQTKNDTSHFFDVYGSFSAKTARPEPRINS